MREHLNSNPLLQVAVIAVLLIGTGFFVLSTMGGSEEESEPTETTTTISKTTITTDAPETVGEAMATALSLAKGAISDAPSPPRPVLEAWRANQTIVLLFVHDGGIDDRMVAASVRRLRSLPGVVAFVVPAQEIARYAAITEGVGVDRVPALVVVRPKRLKQLLPTASVSYGFQSPESVIQQVVDADYTGRAVDYHP